MRRYPSSDVDDNRVMSRRYPFQCDISWNIIGEADMRDAIERNNVYERWKHTVMQIKKKRVQIQNNNTVESEKRERASLSDKNTSTSCRNIPPSTIVLLIADVDTRFEILTQLYTHKYTKTHTYTLCNAHAGSRTL